MIVTIRTDRPEAEVGLYARDGTQLGYKTWVAHRELSATLLATIRDELAAQQATFSDLDGIVAFRGLGSFTGLRIGLTVANALAYSNTIPIVGSEGEVWQQAGIEALRAGSNDQLVLPVYGQDAHITPPRK